MKCSRLPLIFSLAILGTISTSYAADDYEKLKMPKFLIGACTHFGQGKGVITENLSMLKQAGIMATRDEASWGGTEREKGKLAMSPRYLAYNKEAHALKLYPLTILDYANGFYEDGNYPRKAETIEGFCRYSEFSAQTLKDYCRLYQVWNEWDGGCGMPKQYKGTGDPASYVKLLKAVYPRVKKAYPEAIVVTGSVCTGDKYLEKLMKLGMLDHCDVVSLHTYNYGRGNPEQWYTRMVGVDKMLRKYSDGKEVPLYITEMGYPTQLDSRGTDPEKSATYLARVYLLARTLPYIKGIWWYDFQNDGWDAKHNENNFGIIKADMTPKPSYEVMADISNLVANADFVERINVNDPDIWVLKYRYAAGKDALAIWSSHDDNDWQVTLTNSAANPTPVSVRRVGAKAIKRQWVDRKWDESRQAQLEKGSFRLVVRGRPWIIEGDLAGVTIKSVAQKEFPEGQRVVNAILLAPKKIGKASPLGAKPIVNPFGGLKNYRCLIGDQDYRKDGFDAQFSAKYEKKKLHLNIRVTDDVFSQDQTGDSTWQGDGLQIGFKRLGAQGGSVHKYTELDIALTKDGPIVYCRSSQIERKPGILNGLDVKINREGNVTNYQIGIPIDVIGLPELEKGSVIGLSMLVNDNDGKGRKGYLHWGEGIGHSKDPLSYNWILMD